MPSQPTPRPSQAFNDTLAKMMQAEVNEGGPPPATPCDTPAEVISTIHAADPDKPTPSVEDMMQMTKSEFEATLTKHLDRLRDEILATRVKGATLTEAAHARWNETMADLEAKQKGAREKLAEVTESTGEAWNHLRHGASNAWNELERAVRKARAEF